MLVMAASHFGSVTPPMIEGASGVEGAGAQHHLGRGTPPDGLPERSQCGADHESGMARVVRLGGGGKSALSAANTPRLATRNNQRISSRERCYPRAPLRWCA